MVFPKLDRNRLAVGVFAVFALAILGGIVWSFGQQFVLLQQMREEDRHLEQMVMAEQSHHDVLLAELEYVETEEYVERWAREEARMTKPGEVLVIPSFLDADDDAEPAEVQSDDSSAAQSRSFWVVWWKKVFAPGR